MPAFSPRTVTMAMTLSVCCLLLVLAGDGRGEVAAFELEEATIESIHRAFATGELTSRGLVELYLRRIASVDPTLHAIIELDPDGALAAADRADAAARSSSGELPPLHGAPVLLKDNIAAAGPGQGLSLSPPFPRFLGYSHSIANWFSCSPKNHCCSATSIDFGLLMQNPYVPSATTCSSSSGSAIAAAANMAAVTIGTETDGSIMCPSSYNSVVGIKPTVGLTSRAGVIIISQRMDTIG